MHGVAAAAGAVAVAPVAAAVTAGMGDHPCVVWTT
jgi:hypothetical protein